MKNLKAGPEARGLQVQLAQATAAPQLVADEQIFPIETAANRLELRVHRQGFQLGQLVPTAADAIGQGIHQWMNAAGGSTGAHGRRHQWILRGSSRHHGAPKRQQADPASRMQISTHGAPLPGSPAPVSPLPEPIHDQLGNGVALVQLPLPEAPVVCLDFWCRAGSGYETQQESGMAHFLEHMVFKGSHQLPAGEFDRRVEALGGSSNAATGFDDVHYHVLIPAEAAPQALELLLDLVLHPRIDSDDFAMERQVVLEELAQSEDQPEEVAVQTLLREACPGHAYGLPILGERGQLEQHQPEAMAAFHRQHYRADRCCLAVAGPLARHDLKAQLEGSALAELAAGAQPAALPELVFQPGRSELALPRLEAARLLMAWRLPGAADQQSVTGADLLTTLLAEGRRSRLVERLREQRRLVESIDLDLNVLEAGCLVLLEAVCEPEQLERVEQQVREVLDGLLQAPPSTAELERAKRLVGNGYRFSLEAAGSVAGMVGNSCLWGRRHDLQAPLDWLEAWDGERLTSEMAPWLAPERAHTLLARPA